MPGQPGEWIIERRGHGLYGPSRTKEPAPVSSGIGARVRPCPREREMVPKPGDQAADPRDGPSVRRVTRAGLMTFRSVGVGTSSRTVRHRSWSGPTFQSCPPGSGAVQRLGYTHGGTAANATAEQPGLEMTGLEELLEAEVAA